MDWIRYTIIASIVGIALILVNEWTAFKKEHALAPRVEARAETRTAAPIDQDIPAADAPLPAASVNNEELPASTIAETSSSETSFADTDGDSRIVRVRTDTLLADIDLLGGDIVGVALPQQLASLDSDQPFVLLERNAQRVYMAQSGLIGSNGTDKAAGRPTFSTDQHSYTMAEGSDQLLVNLKLIQTDGTRITKRFTFNRGDYLVKVDYLVDNQSDNTWSGSFYAQLKRDSSADPAADTTGMGMQPFLGVATMTKDKPYVKIAFDDLREKPLNTLVDGGWVAIVQHYFISAWVPADPGQYHYSTKVTSNGDNLIRYTSPELKLAAGDSGQFNHQFYAGPKDQYRLKEIAPGLDLTVDYGWLWWIAQPLFWIMTQIHKLVGNWGWSIILLTVLVKAVFFPLSAASYRSMARMRKVTPKMTQIREMYADDKQKQSQEMMALYKKEKVNPLGGCLPILIQMPVFISLYWVLMESVELRHAPWLGWIKDLSTMDPYYILPLIMGVSMFAQQKLNPPPPDPTQAKIMQLMPVFFTFFFLWFPAGLVLYWVVNNLLSILQQWIITRQIEAAD
jgi:YidC/Oxa1 family membrane protein insertase